MQSLWLMVLAWRWTPLLAAGAALGFFSLKLRNSHKRWKRGWLSGAISARLQTARTQAPKKMTAKISWRGHVGSSRLASIQIFDQILSYFQHTLLLEIKQIVFPSVISFILIFFTITLFFILPHQTSIPYIHKWQDVQSILTIDLQKDDKTFGDRVIGAFSGLLLVVIALIIFVAESIRDDNDSERKRVLVRISWLWPLGVAATLMPFGFLWSPARGATVLLECVLASFTLLAFARVIRALLDPDTRAQNRIGLLRSRIKGMIFESVSERIGNTILLDQIGPGKYIDTIHYTFARSWVANEAADYIFVDAAVDGWLSDVHLEELKKLGELLDRYARENLGFVLRESGPVPDAAQEGGKYRAPPQNHLEVRKVYLLKRYREEIPQDSAFYGKRRSLLALPAEFERDQSLLSEIHAKIPYIFRFTRDAPSSVSIRREMEGTKDQLSRAIREHALGAIDDLRQIYLQISEEFLTQLVEIGGGYSAEQARKERGSFFQSWTEIHWIVGDVRELIVIASEIDNADVFGKIGFLPFAIVMRALQVSDHYLFQQFFQFAPFIYFLASEKTSDSPARKWMAENSWRWSKEIVNFYIESELNNPKITEERLAEMQDFALFSLRVFQDILKSMADKRDVPAFLVVAGEFRKLYERFRNEKPHPSLGFLRSQLDQTTDENVRITLLKTLRHRETRDECSNVLEISIDSIFLALGGRLLAQLFSEPDNEQGTTLLNAVKSMLPNGLEQLAASYADASDWRTSERWGWDDWDSIADGKARWVDKHTKLNQIFAVRALEMFAPLTALQRESIKFPVGHSLAEMARENNTQGINATLIDIETRPDRWQNVLSEEARNCIPDLRACLAAVVAAQRVSLAERTRESVLDPKKLSEFRTELTQAFHDNIRLRPIIGAKNAIELRLSEEPNEGVPSLSINQIDDKDAFVEQDRTSYVGWGRGYGEGLAKGENEGIYSEIIAGAGLKREILSGGIIESITSALNEIQFEDPIILHSIDYVCEVEEIRASAFFVPKYEINPTSPWSDFYGFIGNINIENRQVPVFDIFVHSTDLNNKIIIVDINRFMRVIQYYPGNNEINADYVSHNILIRVTDLNESENIREDIIAQNPPWLNEIADRGAYLCGRVLVNVIERYRVAIIDRTQAICFNYRPRSEST